ncbi:hypothetical protein C0585_05505 [Candidatus Woesearchaeota archaeon]|nr:MAG: hypothetical protein C0585_05505 [Candidatus Woesearchaeota archaeon]
MKKIIVMLLLFTFGLVSFAFAEETEILYLADSTNAGAGYTDIYMVYLDSLTNRANLEPILGSPIPYTQVDALAASSDGATLYAIDKGSAKLGMLNVETGIFTDTGNIINDGGTKINDIVLAAVSPEGVLYVASQTTNEIYSVDLASSNATSLGKVLVGSSPISLSGADLVFASDGTLYVWANGGDVGLYKIDDYMSSLDATYLGMGTGDFFTGLAIRDNGAGDLVGSNTVKNAIVVINKSDASMPVQYDMYLNGTAYPYGYGDMTAGPIIEPLMVTKTVETSYDLTYDWTIEKVGSETNITIEDGQSYNISYDVTVSSIGVESNHVISGMITIMNPNVVDASITSITDSLANVDCGGITYPYVLAAGATLECTYSTTEYSEDTTNIVTVTTDGIIEGNEFSEDVIFGEPTNIYDESVTVSDSMVGELGIVDAIDAPETFSYDYMLVGECDGLSDENRYLVENTASFVTSDTQTIGNDSWNVEVTVPCDLGCTLTQGYWKTHSEYGPAPEDLNWLGLPNGPDTIFYLSSMTWYEVFHTPIKSNKYYSLAHQYMAAKLNVMNGATTTVEVDQALDDAENLFITYGPEDVVGIKIHPKNGKEMKDVNKELSAEMTSIASVLAEYNEGYIGPGHCDEQPFVYERLLG